MRAVLALGSLVAYFVVAVLFSVGLGVAAVWLLVEGYYWSAIWSGFLAFLFGAPTLLSASIVFRRGSTPEPHGVPLTREAQPELWQLVDDAAEVAGSRRVDEIRLVLDLHACVEERRGRRLLDLGLPLVAGFTVSELRALLAAQFVYHDGRGSALDATAYRTRERLDAAARHLESTFHIGTRAFAKVYGRVTAPIVEAREQHATERSVAAGTPGITQRVTHSVPSLLEYWKDFCDTFLTLAQEAGRTPPLLAGFLAYLDHRPDYVCDSCQALAASETAPRDERPAWTIIDGVELAAQQLLLPPRPFAEWQEIVEIAGPLRAHRYAGLLEHAGRVSRIGPALGDILDALARGELRKLTGETVDLSLSREETDRAAAETVTELLAFTVVDRLMLAGLATLELNWGGMFSLRVPQGGVVHPEVLVAPAVRDPALVPQLRAHLQVMGVDGL